MEYGFQEQEGRVPFARGGPIYVPNLVGPITTVHEFKASVIQELQSLKAECGTAGDFNDELSVEELKVFTEEELVDKALKEAFEDAPGTCNPLQLLEHCNGEKVDHPCVPGEGIVCSENSTIESSNLGSSISNYSSIRTPDAEPSERKTEQKKRKKRGRYKHSRATEVERTAIESHQKKRKKRGRTFDRQSRAAELESSYFDKVEQLSRIKQKQDEDKVTARLHSFSGSCKSVEGAISASEKIERMRSLRFITSPVKVKPLNSQEHVPLCYPEVVLCVEVYHKKNASKKSQEFLVLGGQILTELRDNIYCLTDNLMKAEGQHDPSGYFLIEDVFCNDLRNSSAIDYSEPIFDWLKNSKNEAGEKWEYIMSGELKKKQKELLGDMEISNLPNFKAVDMHRTRFSDLRFRLGAGYLYCHQGDCKHIIVIRDMRLIHPEDAQNQADYPLLTFQLRPRYRKCSVCKMFQAKKMTVDDKWAQKNPCYFCNDCWFLLHCKDEGSLLYTQFEDYVYYHE